MELNFNLLYNKTALITGASKGIGKAIAETFAKNGANLILLSRDEKKLSILCKELIDLYGIKVVFFVVDITDEKRVKEIFIEIKKMKISLDILVNNAGIMEDAILQMVKPEAIHKTYATNVFALIDISKRGSKLMIRNKKGTIINLSSIIGVQGSAGQTIYSSSKSAVIGFTKSLSKELAPFNIRVNGLAPGFIDTEMTHGKGEDFYERNLQNIGLRRFGKPQDVANTALFLASDLSEYLTGQIIGVDGGMVI